MNNTSPSQKPYTLTPLVTTPIPGKYSWFFKLLFFIMFYVLGIISLYIPNTEIIGFGIFFSAQVLLAYSIIREYSKNPNSYSYNDNDPKHNIGLSGKVVEFVVFLKPLLNVRVAVIFEIIMMFVSLLLILITYGNINTQYKGFGINAITNLSNMPNANNTIINEKENFKIILIVITILVFFLFGINQFYDIIIKVFEYVFTSSVDYKHKHSVSVFYFFMLYFVGSVIFLFFGYLPLNVINTNSNILDTKQQLAIKILSVFNMFWVMVFGLTSYIFFGFNRPRTNNQGSKIHDTITGLINFIYLLCAGGIYYLSCWEIYISNNIMLHFLPSKLTDPSPPSGVNAPPVQMCDPNKPETCPTPGFLPLQWLYNFGMNI